MKNTFPHAFKKEPGVLYTRWKRRESARCHHCHQAQRNQKKTDSTCQKTTNLPGVPKGKGKGNTTPSRRAKAKERANAKVKNQVAHETRHGKRINRRSTRKHAEAKAKKNLKENPVHGQQSEQTCCKVTATKKDTRFVLVVRVSEHQASYLHVRQLHSVLRGLRYSAILPTGPPTHHRPTTGSSWHWRSGKFSDFSNSTSFASVFHRGVADELRKSGCRSSWREHVCDSCHVCIGHW